MYKEQLVRKDMVVGMVDLVDMVDIVFGMVDMLVMADLVDIVVSLVDMVVMERNSYTHTQHILSQTTVVSDSSSCQRKMGGNMKNREIEKNMTRTEMVAAYCVYHMGSEFLNNWDS